MEFNGILTIKGYFWCFLRGNTLFYTRMREWAWAPADLADLRGFFGCSRRLFFILSQISQITQIFITVLTNLTRSFLGWEAMGLGIGSYEIVVRKLVGEMYRALTITVLTVFLEKIRIFDGYDL